MNWPTVDLTKIKNLRKDKMSLEEMSKLLGFKTPNGYFYIESGKTKMTANQLVAIADILEVKIDELFTAN